MKPGFKHFLERVFYVALGFCLFYAFRNFCTSADCDICGESYKLCLLESIHVGDVDFHFCKECKARALLESIRSKEK